MAGRRPTRPDKVAFAQTPDVSDPKVQRALDVVTRAIHELQSKLGPPLFTATVDGIVPASGGSASAFLAADGAWKTIVGAGAVDSVTAGSSMVTASPTVGAVVINVVPGNFTGIPETGVTGLVADLAARPTGSGTAGRSTRWSAGTVLADGAFVDNGTNVSLAGTLTLSLMTAGSLLFAGVGGLVSQDNANFFWDDANNRLGIGTNAPVKPLHVAGDTCITGASSILTVGTTGITMPLFVATTEFSKDGDFNSSIVSVYSSLDAGHCGEHMSFRGRGTASAPAAVQSGDYIGQFAFTGASSATTHFSGALIRAATTEGWVNPSNVGTKLEFLTTTNASTGTGRAVRLTIDHSGATTVTGTASGDTLTSNNTGTGLTGNIALFAGTNSTTLNTTGGALISYAYYGDAASTRSAGANNLTNVGIRLRARNGQVNRAIWAQEGDVLLNDTSGTTRIGPSFTPDAAAQFHVRVSSSGATAAAAGSTIVSEVNGVSYITVKGPASTAKGVLFSNTTAANDGGVIYDDSTFARGLWLRAAGTNFVTISSAGAVIIGSATTQSHTINGRAALTSTTSTASAFAATYSATTGTTNTLSAAVATNSGTFNTTAGALSEFALRAVSSASRSAGANNLTGVAGYFSSTGAQVNVAIQTDSGSNYLNTTAGTTGIGYALGAALPSTLSVTGSGTFTTTLDVTGDFNVNTNKFSVVAASGNTTVAGTLAVNGNATIGDASTDAHTINGSVVIADDGLASGSLRVTNTPVGSTGAPAIVVAQAGTFDTTAAARYSIGSYSDVSSTISAGANALNNIGFYGNVSGGTNNYAIYTDNGDNRFNVAGGTSTFVRNVAINGNATIGDAAGDAHTVNGTITFAHGVTMSSTLAVSGNATVGDAAGDAHTVNGTLTCANALVVNGTTTLGDAVGDTVLVGSDYTQFAYLGGNGDTYVYRRSLNFDFYTDADTAGIINNIGYGGGATRYRDLQIGDGKAGVALYVNGSEKSLRFGASTGPLIKSGSGTPEAAVTAPVGSLFLRTDGGASTTLYVKESGTGNTGWVAK